MCFYVPQDCSPTSPSSVLITRGVSVVTLGFLLGLVVVVRWLGETSMIGHKIHDLSFVGPFLRICHLTHFPGNELPGGHNSHKNRTIHPQNSSLLIAFLPFIGLLASLRSGPSVYGSHQLYYLADLSPFLWLLQRWMSRWPCVRWYFWHPTVLFISVAPAAISSNPRTFWLVLL